MSSGQSTTARDIIAGKIAPAPMEARLASALPTDPGWQFEPKWDGFRAIVARDGDAVRIWSKSGKPLERFFPEVEAMVRGLADRRFVVDGELVIERGGAMAFDALQARLHPAHSRIKRLATETPAKLVVFDCISRAGRWVADLPLARRRTELESFHAESGGTALLLSPASSSVKRAKGWFDRSGGALDGVIAKRCDEPYRFGERAMVKVKPLRTADCVVGGYRRAADGSMASLLLGLFDADGLLDHVGFVSGLSADVREEVAWIVKEHEGAPGFTGKAPGGPSRWNGGEKRPYVPLDGQLVLEVTYDQVTAARFRHAARFVRWRPDKAPAQCTLGQLAPALAPSELVNLRA